MGHISAFVMTGYGKELGVRDARNGSQIFHYFIPLGGFLLFEYHDVFSSTV